MPLIKWNDSYSVGHDEIDRQHKRWIAMLNKAHDTMMDGDYNDLAALSTTAVNEMVSYIKDHFVYEEAYMKKIRFPGLKSHKDNHDLLVKQIDTMALEIHRGEYILNSEILKLMENWLKNHILIEDQKYAVFASDSR